MEDRVKTHNSEFHDYIYQEFHTSDSSNWTILLFFYFPSYEIFTLSYILYLTYRMWWVNFCLNYEKWN